MNSRGVGRRRRRAQRMYRLLVRLYPAAHRRAFGEQMVQTFGDHYGDAVEGRGDSRLRFWLAVLADVATSLLTEHAAEARARHRQAPTTVRRPRRAGTRTDGGSMCGARKRRVRVARRLRYRRRGDRTVRVVIRTRHHRLVYRGRIAALIALAALTGVALGTGTATGHLGIGALLAGLSVTAWLAHSLRLTRPVPAGPHGDGPAPPGSASVREPRRPLPISPTGSTARPRPDQDEPGQAIALI
jgi:hypothetical protein